VLPRILHALLLSAPILLSVGIARSQGIIEIIRLPSSTYWNSAWGLTSDGTHLYVASNTSDATNGRKIMKLNFAGQAVDSIIAPPGVVSSQGLAIDSSGNFYYLRRYTSAGTIMKLSPAGALLDTFRVAKFLGGVGWDGTHVWYSVYSPDVESGLYKLDLATKTVVDTILVSTLQPYGITWDGTYLYYVENGFQGDPRGVFRIDPATGDTVGFIPEHCDVTSNGTSLRDVAWDGQYFWTLGEPVGASSGRSLYKIDLGAKGTPDINLVPTVADFGQLAIGLTDTISITVQNVCSGELTIDSVAITLSGDFASLLSTPVIVPPNSSISLLLTFTPSGYGSDSAGVVLYSDDPDEQAKYLGARGFGIFGGPVIGVPTGYNFASRRVGSTNSWRMNIQNQGGGQLSISSMTLSAPAFYLDSLSFPVIVDSSSSKWFRVWFNPTSGVSYLDTLKITSNAANGPVTNVVLQGVGNAAPIPIGQPLWEFTVPNHPISNTFRLVKGVRAIGDVTGDGMPDVIVSTENYWTMAVNGNASVTNDSLWAFTTYISNSSAGSIGSTGSYSHQKALAIASDLNGDGYNDVVIGTGGGNEHVYALNGKTGQMLWTFGTDHPDSFGLGDFDGVDASTDFNNDGVPDVLAAAGATQSGGIGGRRTIFLFNGTNGNILWLSPLLGFTHAVTAIPDITGDGVPDAIGTVGEPTYKASAFSGANGSIIWDFAVPSASGGGKEVIVLPLTGQTHDVILGAFWGPVYRLDGETGTQVWSYTTGSGGGVMQLARLRDVTGDGVDEVLVALLGGGARCLNGANGQVVWSISTGNTMGIATLQDLNQDGYDEAVVAAQSQGAIIVRGQDGVQLGFYTFGSNQNREVAAVPDMDGNYSVEVVVGSQQGNVALFSGGVDAGPVSVGESGMIPEVFSISQNYPNPFNPLTTIGINLPFQADLRLTIHDILGREIRAFEFERMAAGVHQVAWDGTDMRGFLVSSGVYFYRATIEGRSITKRMLFLK